MPESRRAVFMVAVGLVCALGSRPAGAQEPTAQRYFELFPTSAADQTALAQGEIVRLDGDDLTDADLFVGFALRIERPVTIVAAVLEEAALARLHPETLVELGADQPFPSIELGAADADEVERLVQFSSGREVNIDAPAHEELQALDLRLPPDAAARRAVADVYGRMLRRRYEAYRASGLSGLAPYTRGRGREMSAAEHLRVTSTATLDALHALAPAFVGAVRRYSEIAGEHAFFLVRQPYNGRPLHVLLHLLAERGPRHLVVLYREYFVGHSYDANQLWLACLPDGEATLVVLGTDAITDEAVGFPQGVRHRVGRDRVRAAARPLLEDVRRRAEAEGR